MKKQYLLLKNIAPKTHEGVLSMIGLHVIRESDVEAYYGKALRFAKEEREKSDYDVLAMITEEEAESIVEDVARFLERIKRAIEDLNEGRSSGGTFRHEQQWYDRKVRVENCTRAGLFNVAKSIEKKEEGIRG